MCEQLPEKVRFGSIDILAGVLFEILGQELPLEAIPHNPHGKRFVCPHGEIVNYFSPRGRVTVQGQGDPFGMLQKLRENMYRDVSFDLPHAPIHPVIHPSKVENTVLVMTNSMQATADLVSDALRAVGLAPIIWEPGDGKTFNSRLSEIDRMIHSLRFAVFLMSPTEWKRGAIQAEFAMVTAAVRPQQVALVLSGTQRISKANLPDHVRTFLMRGEVEDWVNPVIKYMSTRFEPRLKRLMYAAAGAGQRVFIQTLDHESRIDVPIEPRKKRKIGKSLPIPRQTTKPVVGPGVAAPASSTSNADDGKVPNDPSSKQPVVASGHPDERSTKRKKTPTKLTVPPRRPRPRVKPRPDNKTDKNRPPWK